MKAVSDPSSTSNVPSKEPEDSDKKKKAKQNNKNEKNKNKSNDKADDDTSDKGDQSKQKKKNPKMIIGKPLKESDQPVETSETEKGKSVIKENKLNDQRLVKESSEVAYRLKADIENGAVQIDGVIDRLFNTPLNSITIGDILGVSKPVREAVKKAIVAKRVPVNKVETSEENVLPSSDVFTEEVPEVTNFSDLPKAQMFIAYDEHYGLPKGSVVVEDPITNFLNTGGDMGRLSKLLIKSTDSEQLMTVFPVINNRGPIQCILDGGSQIVSMNKDVAVSLHLSWNPSVRIAMQSANGSVNRTLGIARNVPFKFDDLTFYLQVHVIEDVAYKVLLGRPFEIITGAVFENFTNGEQRLTIREPLSGKKITIPTIPRDANITPREWPGSAELSQPEEDFRPRTSKN
jgi:hypothetical protein